MPQEIRLEDLDLASIIRPGDNIVWGAGPPTLVEKLLEQRAVSNYADDFEMTSPLIVEWMGVASGTLKGKEAIRPYWERGLATRPPLRFELLDVLAGVNSVAIYYRSVTRSKLVVERIEFNSRRHAIRAEALYRAA